MAISWDRSDDRIWFGKFSGEEASDRLYVVVECLPRLKGWDWAVWRGKAPRMLARGISRSASQAASAAEMAAMRWQRVNDTLTH